VRLPAKTDYALRAVISLARAGGGCRSSQVIADEQQIPQGFLEHILNDLRRAGLVSSQRGGRGGYRLAVPPQDLTLAAIVNAVDPQLLARPTSADNLTGPAAETIELVWLTLHTRVQDFLEGMTLADISR